MPSDNGFPFSRLLSGVGENAVRAVRLGLGVLATTAAQNITGLVAMAAVAIFMRSTPYFALGGEVILLLFLIYSNERSFRFAEKHPIPALMGGGALLEYLRDQSSKNKDIVVTDAPPVAGGPSGSGGDNA
jgi:hypothetical protein